MKLAEAILATLTYSDHFSYPLTLSELEARLLTVKATSQTVSTTVARLVREKKISQNEEYFYLPGRQKIVALRHVRSQLARPKLARAQRIARLLMRFPTVLAIFVTGSLAVENVKAEDDIDLMIITKNKRLWTTRLAITLAAELLGLRRRPFDAHAQNKICLNLYLTPASFTLPRAKRSLYTAYELIQARPLADPHNMRATLLATNPWLRDYLPNFALPKKTNTPANHQKSRPHITESLAYRFQKWYMRGKLTREYITPDAAFFHPQNPGDLVLSKIKEVK